MGYTAEPKEIRTQSRDSESQYRDVMNDSKSALNINSLHAVSVGVKLNFDASHLTVVCVDIPDVFGRWMDEFRWMTQV